MVKVVVRQIISASLANHDLPGRWYIEIVLDVYCHYVLLSVQSNYIIDITFKFESYLMIT